MSRFVPSAALPEVLDAATRGDRKKAAQQVVMKARNNNNDDTGHYDRSLQTFDDERGVGAETTDIAGHLIEYGSINNDPQAPIRTAAADVGRFEPT